MNNMLILHDLPQEAVTAAADRAIAHDGRQAVVFAQSPVVRPCVGCFGCWTKTPGRCVIADHDSEFASMMPLADTLVVISRLVFGGFSPNVKAVLDRNIGFMLPFFRMVDGEMHHVPRYDKRPSLRYLFYGESMTKAEQETARQLIHANALNLGTQESAIEFFETPEKALEALR